MFTTSPSAVKSFTASFAPVDPTNACPRCTAAPTGIGPVPVASGRPTAWSSARAALIAAAVWPLPEIPMKNKPITSSPTNLSTIPSLSRIAFDVSW